MSPDTNAQTCRVQNPALRQELGFEMGQIHSDMALHFGADDDDDTCGFKAPKPVLPRAKGKYSSKVPNWHKQN